MKNWDELAMKHNLKVFQMVWTFHKIFKVILELTFKA